MKERQVQSVSQFQNCTTLEKEEQANPQGQSKTLSHSFLFQRQDEESSSSMQEEVNYCEAAVQKKTSPSQKAFKK
jgi:hypothetical protein